MNCTAVREALAATLDPASGELSAAVREHMGECPGCAESLEMLSFLPGPRTAESRPDGKGAELAVLHRLARSVAGRTGAVVRWLSGFGERRPGKLRLLLALYLVGVLLAMGLRLSLEDRSVDPYRDDSEPDAAAVSSLRAGLEELEKVAGFDLLENEVTRFSTVALVPGQRLSQRAADLASPLRVRGIWWRGSPTLAGNHVRAMVLALRQAQGSPLAWVTLLKLAGMDGGGGINNLRRAIWDEIAKSPPRDTLTWVDALSMAGHLGLVDTKDRTSACLALVEARWDLLRRYPASADRVCWLPGLLVEPGLCQRCREERCLPAWAEDHGQYGYHAALPLPARRLALARLDQLAAARLRHIAELQGTTAALRAATSPEWALPELLLLLRILQVILPLAGLGLLAWIALTARRLPEAPAPAGFMLAGAGLLASVQLMFAAPGGLLWWDFSPLWDGIVRLPCLDSASRALEGVIWPDARVASGALLALIAATLPIAFYLPLIGRLPFASRRAVAGVMLPPFLTLLLLGHAQQDSICVEAPLFVAALALAAGRRWIQEVPLLGSVALWTATLAAGNLLNHAAGRDPSPLTLAIGTLLLAAISLPFWMGFELVQLPLARARRRLRTLVVVLAAGVAAGAIPLLRLLIAETFIRAGAPPASADVALLGMAAMLPLAAIRLGALLAPEGAGALGGES